MTEKSRPQKGKMPGPIDIARRTPGEEKLPVPATKRPSIRNPKPITPKIRKNPDR